MKRQLVATVLTLLITISNYAYSRMGPEQGKSNKETNNSAVAMAKGAQCDPATAQLTMQFNDVSALIEQGGSMFQNRGSRTPAYEVPRGGGIYAIYAGALWMGGTDVNGQLKLAALRFREGNDFWPGPLGVDPNTGNYDALSPMGPGDIRSFGAANTCREQCVAYDEFYTIRRAEVIHYETWWVCENENWTDACEEIDRPSNEVLNRIYNWPAHGQQAWGADYYLAPFYDRNADGKYDPKNDGDIPGYDDIFGRDEIVCGVDRRVALYGDETHWWVFNDKGNIHTETNGDPIGMEIRAQAFSFATSDEINRMTFFNYELINRGTQTLKNTYFSQYLDPDIGNANDDYVGCDVSRGLGYAYNGDNFDQDDGGTRGYGAGPPAIGVDFFEGPYQDPDGLDNPGPYYDTVAETLVVPSVIDALAKDGIVYKGIGVGYSDSVIDNERFGMRRFTYYTRTAEYPYRDPESAAEYYNFMEGLWANGSEMFYGGQGYPASGSISTPSDYMFPGDSDPLHWSTGGYDPGFDWSEESAGNEAADRRFVQSAGPFTLKPGAVNNITVGIVYGRDEQGGFQASVDAMKRADTKAQALFDACFEILTPPDAPRLIIQEMENQLILSLDNPVTSNNYLEGYAEEDKVNIINENVDRVYTFEGYQIYQMVDEAAGVSDIGDETKARLVAQCDIKNNISRIVNHEFDEGLGFDMPDEKVDGENKGIRHTFLVTEDEFALGDRRLVNHKKYYFIAVAYAHNEFKKYDPNDPDALDGQKIPYISSRLSYDGTAIRSIEAIPHNPMPEADGTGQHIAYGSGPIITRLDGHGNGNRSVELTQESIDFILENGFMETPSYDYGKSPINIKVVDPLNVAPGYFECKFRDYTPSGSNAADGAKWVIYRYDQFGGTLMDSVLSERAISSDNEQIIAEWGVSVQIYQQNYFTPEGVTGGTEAKVTDFIESSITFSDSSKIWLSGVQDNDAFYPTNWVRSGTYNPNDDPNLGPVDCMSTNDPNYQNYLDPCNYQDEIFVNSQSQVYGVDKDKVFSNILNGTIAPHRLIGHQTDYMPMAYYDYGSVTTVKRNASISFLPSIDIVLTNDPTKWTRCPVIELGRDASLNTGGAEPGALRKSYSRNRDGSLDMSSMGMSWFPGYAIDLETGARLYMAFGENSFLGQENGSNMWWDPTDRLTNNVPGTPAPLMGGMHSIMIFNYGNATINNYTLGYDYPAYNPADAENLSTHALYQHFLEIEAGNNTTKRNVYGSIGWIGYPMASTGYDLTLGKELPCDVKIRVRVNKEYKNFTATGLNQGSPMYSWNMDKVSTVTGSSDRLAEALQMINVVPNPYYAYSEYERNRLDTRVKITNLPERCTVRIYSTNGKLIRTFKKDSPITSLDWDLNNHKGIPVASGVYLIHVDVPGIGERILKFMGGIRQIDLHGI